MTDATEIIRGSIFDYLHAASEIYDLNHNNLKSDFSAILITIKNAGNVVFCAVRNYKDAEIQDYLRAGNFEGADLLQKKLEGDIRFGDVKVRDPSTHLYASTDELPEDISKYLISLSSISAWSKKRGLIIHPIPEELLDGDQIPIQRPIFESSYMEGEIGYELDYARYKEKCAGIEKRANKNQVEDLDPKSRTSALQLIGGLVISSYKMDIHANRLSGVSEIVGDLNRLGISISPETVSKWIKEAAQVIEKPK